MRTEFREFGDVSFFVLGPHWINLDFIKTIDEGNECEGLTITLDDETEYLFKDEEAEAIRKFLGEVRWS